MKHVSSSLLFVFLFSVSAISAEEFVPAYENEGNYTLDVEEYNADKFVVRNNGRNYYTSGKKNGFRVNENNEESTDETIGILTFVLAPAAIVYMNIIGWWD